MARIAKAFPRWRFGPADKVNPAVIVSKTISYGARIDMIRLTEDDHSEIFEINRNMALGKWDDAAQKAGAMIESIFRRMYNELAGTLNPGKFARLTQKGQEAVAEKNTKPFLPNKATFGDWLVFFRESDLFSLYEQKNSNNHVDCRVLKSIDWDWVVRTRNVATHKGDEKVSPKDAQIVVNALQSLLLAVTDWEPRKFVYKLETFLAKLETRWGYVLFAFLAVVLVWVVWLSPTLEKAKKVDNMLSAHGQEIAEVLEKRGAYDLALWAIDGDPTVIGRDVIRYRLLKLQAQKVKDKDPVEAYVLYSQALNIPVVGDHDAVAQIQKDLLNKMRPGDRLRITMKTAPIYATVGAVLLFLLVVGLIIRVINKAPKARRTG